ncbi:MAG: hypothetical protein ACUVS7_13145 [Bryobacteraceae bacterium]
MLLAGDEFGRSQHGNNNAYCQDNGIGWVDWRLAETNKNLLEFVRALIAFRRRHEMFSHIGWASSPGQEHAEVFFHGVRLHQPDWSHDSRSLAMEARWRKERIFLIANAYWEPLEFELPPDARWEPLFYSGGSLPEVGSLVVLEGRSALLLTASDSRKDEVL